MCVLHVLKSREMGFFSSIKIVFRQVTYRAELHTWLRVSHKQLKKSEATEKNHHLSP